MKNIYKMLSSRLCTLSKKAEHFVQKVTWRSAATEAGGSKFCTNSGRILHGHRILLLPYGRPKQGRNIAMKLPSGASTIQTENS